LLGVLMAKKALPALRAQEGSGTSIDGAVIGFNKTTFAQQ
jgi:hypothetical protein